MKTRVTCPICGDVLESQYDDWPAIQRLGKHLTGKHCAKGKEYKDAMAKAVQEKIT